MPQRLIIAYSMIAAIVAAGAVSLWIFVIREKWARRGRRNDARRERVRIRRAPSNGAQEVFETD